MEVQFKESGHDPAKKFNRGWAWGHVQGRQIQWDDLQWHIEWALLMGGWGWTIRGPAKSISMNKWEAMFDKKGITECLKTCSLEQFQCTHLLHCCYFGCLKFHHQIQITAIWTNGLLFINSAILYRAPACLPAVRGLWWCMQNVLAALQKLRS